MGASDGATCARIDFEEFRRSRHVQAEWVIDCTGRSGLMSRVGPARRTTGPRTVAIVGLWERRPRWALADPSHTHVESYDGGWAWSVPLSAVRRQVTVMLDPQRTAVSGRGRLGTTYREELARTTLIKSMTEGARFIGRPWARDASPYESPEPAADRLLLAGDAASFVDPLSSFGVKKALASAWLAAVVVNSSLRDPALEAPARTLFVARERAMAAGLRRQLEQVSREAADAHAAGFWADRTGFDVASSPGDPDIEALRSDPDVVAAFETIRGRESLTWTAAAGVRRELKPIVVGNEVVLVEHLVSAAFRDGIRYIRNVDLVLLSAVALEQGTIPALFDAYRAKAGPVPLPDFLGALAVLAGKRLINVA